MSRFPKLTETFVLYEMLAVEQQGVDVDVYPLQREQTSTMHPEAVRLTQQAKFAPWMSWAIVLSQWYFLRRAPWAYLSTWLRLLWANLGSSRYFAGAIVFFPKAVHFARQMRESGVTHVHAHFASHPAAAAYVIHRLTQIPYSFTAHGSDLHRDRHMLREKVAAAKFVVTISNYNKELIVTECGECERHKIEVIHCGVDLAAFQPHSTNTRGQWKSQRLRVMCIGTLHEVKGQKHLIEACGLLSQRGIDCECHFLGDGPDRQQLESQAAAGLAERVVFHGAKLRAEVIELVQSADIVAAPSVPTRDGRREGIPVALMEAMACGVPVVASRLSGIPELVEHEVSGLLFPPGDSAALAVCLLRLASAEQLRQRLAQAARETIEQDFNLERNAQRLADRFRAAGEQ